jgi:hypothetical protein
MELVYLRQKFGIPVRSKRTLMMKHNSALLR